MPCRIMSTSVFPSSVLLLMFIPFYSLNLYSSVVFLEEKSLVVNTLEFEYCSTRIIVIKGKVHFSVPFPPIFF